MVTDLVYTLLFCKEIHVTSFFIDPEFNVILIEGKHGGKTVVYGCYQNDLETVLKSFGLVGVRGINLLIADPVRFTTVNEFEGYARQENILCNYRFHWHV